VEVMQDSETLSGIEPKRDHCQKNGEAAFNSLTILKTN